MKKLLILSIALIFMVSGAKANAFVDANGYDLQVTNITSTTANVRVTSIADYSITKPVSVEYYYDACATMVKRGEGCVSTLSGIPPVSVKLSNQISGTLQNLQPNSVYQVRYSVDNNYCPPGAYCTLAYILPTVGSWVQFETPSNGSSGEILTFGSEKLMRGSTGGSVLNLQRVLNKYTGSNLYPDGNFGLATKAAVQAFQMSKNMTPDGVVGAKTKQVLIQLQQGITPLPVGNLQLTNADYGRTIKISKGQSFTVTLNSPSDGLYQFGIADDGTYILSPSARQHINATSGAAGDFGKESWTFYTNKTGITNLKITGHKIPIADQAITLFSATIIVE